MRAFSLLVGFTPSAFFGADHLCGRHGVRAASGTFPLTSKYFSFPNMPVDFLIFATFSVGILLLLWQLLPRLAHGARLPRITWVVVTLVLVGGWFRVHSAGRQEVERIQRLFETIAPTYAAELAHLGHERITLELPPDNPTYVACIEAAKRWMKANKLARSIYTMRRLAEGRTVLIVDPETDYDRNGRLEGEDELRTPIGEVWSGEDPGLELALAGQTNFNEEVITDRWGSWVGVWAPVYGHDGKVEAALGVDMRPQTGRARSPGRGAPGSGSSVSSWLQFAPE
jgi:hypothetical protein